MYLTKRLPRETGRDYAMRTIKENIIRLDLAPGSMVSENELAAALGLSRTPVREALIEISKVKIVEIYPQRGSVVALIDYSMVEEARFMRNIMECAVVELDCQMATDEDIRRLRENVRLHEFYFNGDDPDLLLKNDNEFHKFLFKIAQKEQIYTLMQNIAIHFDRVRRMSLLAVKDPKVITDHMAIVEAIAAHDAAAARAHMEEHLSRYKIDEKDIRKKYPEYFKKDDE